MRSLTFLILFGVIAMPTSAAPPAYPVTQREDRTEELHGIKVADPYRWLEADVRKSDAVRTWVEAQNRITQTYLEAIPARSGLKTRLTELWNYEKYSAPYQVGGRYFFRKNDGLQNQAVLYVQEKLTDTPRVLLDPNGWTKDGTIALGSTATSPNGKYLAYGTSEAGSDWETWKLVDVDTGKMLPDELKWIKFSTAHWTPDNRGFFYGRYPEPKPGAEFQSLNLNQQVMYHRVGSPQSEDVLVYARPDHPEWGFGPTVTEDGKYLILTTWKGTDHRYRVTIRDLSEPYGMPFDLIDAFENDYTFLDNDGPVLYFQTDFNAPNGRIIAIDLRKPTKDQFREVVPQAKEKLAGVNVVGNQLVCSYLKDARSQVKLYSLAGEFVREVEFPAIGTASGFAGKRTDTETFYLFSSYATPPSIYRLDLLTGKSTLARQAQIKVDVSPFEVKQVFYPSKDGTKIPMFIVAKKGLTLDGTNPTLLYGYGGFNISLTPSFSMGVVAWLEMGGVYCVANLRGGGEYGQEWHQAGTKLKKQNVFDDFIGAAEYLIREKYTSPAKLAIKGGSNGGLLVGACLTQRPDLYAACLPHVGVMDMLRFNQFTAGRFWVDDYGTPENADDFKALRAYSPYHNLKKGVKYPATMVITADTDDRVVPGHSFKFLAELQHAQAGESPVIGRIETRAGHGAGKPTSKLIEELADEYAFLIKNLGMTVK